MASWQPTKGWEPSLYLMVPSCTKFVYPILCHISYRCDFHLLFPVAKIMMGLKNVVAECIQQKAKEREVSIKLYKKLMEWGTAIKGKEGFFFWSYLGNTWNYMPQTFRVASRLSRCPFCAQEKQSSWRHEEDEASKPFNPRIDTFKYIVVFPEVLADRMVPCIQAAKNLRAKDLVASCLLLY